MIEYQGSNIKITCDKCGASQSEYELLSNDKFFESGWSLSMNAKKYKHKCGRCNGKNSPVKIWNRLPLSTPSTQSQLSGSGEKEKN